jgi:hypothetical protein
MNSFFSVDEYTFRLVTMKKDISSADIFISKAEKAIIIKA